MVGRFLLERPFEGADRKEEYRGPNATPHIIISLVVVCGLYSGGIRVTGAT